MLERKWTSKNLSYDLDKSTDSNFSDEYLKRVKSYIKTPTKDMERQLEEFTSICSYVSGQYDKDESFEELEKHLQDLEKGKKEQNRVFYMALPPSVFTPVSQMLKKNCYPTNGITRIIVSEPNQVALSYFDQDYLLGRETVRKGPGEFTRIAESLRAKLERRRDFPN